jgi:hypothetical protein
MAPHGPNPDPNGPNTDPNPKPPPKGLTPDPNGPNTDPNPNPPKKNIPKKNHPKKNNPNNNHPKKNNPKKNKKKRRGFHSIVKNAEIEAQDVIVYESDICVGCPFCGNTFKNFSDGNHYRFDKSPCLGWKAHDLVNRKIASEDQMMMELYISGAMDIRPPSRIISAVGFYMCDVNYEYVLAQPEEWEICQPMSAGTYGGEDFDGEETFWDLYINNKAPEVIFRRFKFDEKQRLETQQWKNGIWGTGLKQTTQQVKKIKAEFDKLNDIKVLASQREAELKYSKVKEKEQSMLKFYSETYHAPVKKPPAQETIDKYLSQARAAGSVAGSTRSSKKRARAQAAHAASIMTFSEGDSGEDSDAGEDSDSGEEDE